MFSKNLAINRYLAFAQMVGDRAEECRADVYIGHGVQALPAVDRLKQLNGGLAACDVIEIPSFAKRAVPSKLDPSVLKMIDHGLAGYLREADFLVTVGWALGDLISADHPDVRVIPNYRRYEEFPRNTKIREEFRIPDHAAVVLCISTITSGFGDVLRALARLDDSVHLVTIGKFVPDAYREEIENLRDTLKLQDRVHFRGAIPYEELGPFCSGADVGLIVLDPSIPNNHISLPNRLFDYLAANVPIVSPMMPDIYRVISEHECGVTIDNITPAAWVDGIRQALAQKDAMRRNAAAAAAKLTWESLEEDALHKAYNNAGTVTFVGFNNLAQNNRTMRIAASLANRGVTVKVASPMEETDVLPDGVIPVRMQKV